MRIGITGGIGSGKSIVSKILMANKYIVFNSDDIAKKCISNNTKVQQEIVQLFGVQAFLRGIYNREFISQQIFHSPDLKEQLNQIVHPEVRKEFDRMAEEHIVIFNEAAIFFETGRYKEFDKMILVTAPKEIKIRRLQARDQMTVEQIELRIANQWSDAKKRPLADFEIVNDDEASVIIQLHEILKELAI
jgi:dephospho-CoA kinase